MLQNLSDVIDNTKLQEMFLRFGNILSCKVAMSDDGKSKGYGFVQFESEDSAIASIEQLNGSLVEGKQLYVSFSIGWPILQICNCSFFLYPHLYMYI